MSAFKDAVAADVRKVFINTDEFADVHYLGPCGVPVECIIDRDNTAEPVGVFADRLGVFSNTMTIYVPFDVYPEAPVEGEPFQVDGSNHLVQSVSIEDGILVVVCEASEQ